MVPGSYKKTKAKRSCVRVRRMHIRPGEYQKVKLRTASGGSLTIRYRKALGSCCSGESSSGEAEASCSGHGSDQSFAANTLDENQAFENLEDLLEYSQSCLSGVPAHTLDENQAFENLEDLLEYSQSCLSGVPAHDACDAVYGCDMQPDFSSYHFWSSDDCNSSDIGSNEVLPELTSDSIDFPTADPIAMNERFLDEQADIGCAAFEQTQCYTLEQSAMLIQQLKSFSNEGTEVASTLVCMEAYENLAGASFWSINRSDTSLEEGQLMESCAMPFLGLPPLLDQPESSEIELIDLPPLLRYESADTICAQDSTLHERYKHAYENVAAGCVDFKEDAELFDENNYFLLDPGMPDEVDVMNSGVPQSPSWSVFLENTLQEVAEEAVQQQLTAVKEAGKNNTARPRHVKEAVADHDYMATWEDITSRHEVRAPAVSDSMGQASRILSDPLAIRGKKLRKKRLRRAAPLNTLRSLLSIRDESPPIQHQRRRSCPASETNFQVTPMCNTINVFFRRKARRKDINNSKPLWTAVHEQDFCDDTLCSEVTKRSNDDSSMISQLDPGSKRRIGHQEKVTGRRFSDPDHVYRSVHEIHNSLSHNSEMQKRTRCTSSEDEMVNQDSVMASSKRSYQGSVIASSQRRYQNSGRRARGRPDARGKQKYSSYLPEQAVATLRKWFDDHISFPFADKEQKLDLVSQTGLRLTQVENWLSNYRHRLKVRRSHYEGNVFRPEKAWTRQ